MKKNNKTYLNIYTFGELSFTIPMSFRISVLHFVVYCHTSWIVKFFYLRDFDVPNMYIYFAYNHPLIDFSSRFPLSNNSFSFTSQSSINTVSSAYLLLLRLCPPIINPGMSSSSLGILNKSGKKTHPCRLSVFLS